AAHVVGGVGDDADGDARLVLGIEHVLDRHRAAPAPAGAAPAVEGRLLGRIDVSVPFDDHACPPRPTVWLSMRARHRRRKKASALKSFNFLAWVRSAKAPGRSVMDDVRKPSLKS